MVCVPVVLEEENSIVTIDAETYIGILERCAAVKTIFSQELHRFFSSNKHSLILQKLQKHCITAYRMCVRLARSVFYLRCLQVVKRRIKY